jgi:hypothetical protein
VILSFQDTGKLVYNTIPHFAIRLIIHLEANLPADKKIKIATSEFQFIKDLANAIFRVVGYFRKNIVLDQSDLALAKTKFKHNLVFQANTALTVYTPHELIHFPSEDIVDLKIEDPNYDLFNKESLMMGTHFIA